MTQRARRFRLGFVVVVGLLSFAVGAAWTLSLLTDDPSDRQGIFLRIRIGMSLDEAIAAADKFGDCDALYIEGQTRSGRSFDSLVVTPRDLPIPQEVQHGVLSVEDTNGDSVDVILGPGAIVTGKRFNPYSSVDLWLHRLHQVFGR
jgi:hypothetical protein